MRHNQASHAGLSLQYRQDLCSIRRCFSPKALDITFHSFPYYFPVHSLDFRTPVLWKPLAVEKASALGRGGRGNNKKVEQQEDGPTGLAKAPVSVCFPAPENQSSYQEAAGVGTNGTSKLLALPSPPGKGEGGRARQERQNPAFDQPPSTTHYASKREDQATCFLTESNKNISSKTLTAKTTPLVGSRHCNSDLTGASILFPPSSSLPPPKSLWNMDVGRLFSIFIELGRGEGKRSCFFFFLI